MLGSFHYHGLIRKYIAVFGTLFNDIKIKRIDSNDNITEVIQVPLAYGPKQKFITRIAGSPNLSEKVAITLPRIGFDMTSITYDQERKLSSLNKLTKQGSSGIGTMYQSVPYTLNFGLYILVKNAIDGAMIIEQILPAFKPDFTVTINAVPTMGVKIDIPYVLNGVSVEDSYEGDFSTRRAIIYTLDFSARVQFYPNIKGRDFGDFSDSVPEAALIRTSIVNFHLLNPTAISDVPDVLVLETSSEFSSDAILLEDETLTDDSINNDRMIAETSGAGIDTQKVKSYIKSTTGTGASVEDEFDDYTQVHEIFDSGRDFNMSTGTYE